jgi:hypothetical protein
MQQYLHPQYFKKGGTTWQSRFPEYAAEGRVAVGEVWEMDGPRVANLYRVFPLNGDGFVRTPSRDLDGVAVCRDFYVRLCDLKTIGEDNFLYVLPRR